LTAASVAAAHRLDAQAFVLPGQNKVQIESWFDDGKTPHGARVQVFRANQELLIEGRLDEQGIFVFSYPPGESLRVVVSAGLGHFKELNLSPDELAPAPQTPAASPASPETAPKDRSTPIALADRGPAKWIKDALIGIAFLLAIAAFALGVRNARQLRAVLKGASSGPQK
jgi:hypothetical protein